MLTTCVILPGCLTNFLACLTHLSENMWFQLLHIINKMCNFIWVLAHFLTCLTHVSENLCSQFLHIHMFQKTCDFMVYTLLDTLCYFYMGLCTFSDMFDTCFRKHVTSLPHVSGNMCFYLGFVHIIDGMRDATLVFTRLTTVSTFSENYCFYLGFVHMIDSMCDFALVFAHVVPLLMNFPDNM